MDHHSAYLAKAIEALTPEGHKRVDELLQQLAEVVGDNEAVANFAAARRAEADVGRMEGPADVSPGRVLSRQELDILIPGFRTSVIRSRWTTSRTGQMPSWRCSKTKPAAILWTDACVRHRSDGRATSGIHQKFTAGRLANACEGNRLVGAFTSSHERQAHAFQYDTVVIGSGLAESAFALRTLENGSKAGAMGLGEHPA